MYPLDHRFQGLTPSERAAAEAGEAATGERYVPPGDQVNAQAAAERARTATPAELEADRVKRWQPSEQQRRWAKALFDADLGLERVIVAAAHPGKIRGLWRLGETVEHVPGLWPVPSVRDNGTSYRTARDQAWRAAVAWLGEREGTSSYLVIGRDGHAPAFED